MAQSLVIDEAAAAHAALSPIRRQIIGLIGSASSPTELADRLGVTRQKVNYHLGVLERHGLVEVTETRQRRGFRERLFSRTGPAYVAPDLLDAGSPRDDMSAEAVVAAATDVIRTVGSIARQRADQPTATLRTDVAFASPGDLRAFLADVGELAARYDSPGNGLRIRTTLLAHMSPEGET